MKKFLLFVLCLSTVYSSFAQRGKESLDTKHAVKLNVTNLAFKHLGLEYEYSFHSKMTVALGVRYRPPFNFSSFDALANSDPGNSGDVRFTGSKFSSLAFIPQFRFYTREAQRGFYVGLYGRWRSTPYELNMEVYDYDKASYYSTNFNGHWNALSGGIQIGNQWRIGNNLCLDVTWLGIHYGKNSLDLAWKSPEPLSGQEQQDLVDSFNDLADELNNNRLDFNVNAQGFDILSKYPAIGFRVLAVKFGYRF